MLWQMGDSDAQKLTDPPTARPPAQILLLESARTDAEHVRESILAEMDCEVECVSNAAEFDAALRRRRFDLILCNCSLADGDEFSALRQVMSVASDAATIVISDALTEDGIVECMRLGASDFIWKRRLARLVPAIRHALLGAEASRTRRVQEMAARDRDERFRLLVEQGDDVFWFIALNPERVVYVSPAYERDRGMSVKDVSQEPRAWLEAVQADDRTRVRQAFEACVEGRSAKFNLEYRVVRPDKAIRWIHDRGAPVRNDVGEIVSICGISRDITEKKLNDAKRDWLVTMLEQSLNEVYVFDAKSLRFEFVNSGARRNLGYSMEQLRSMTPLDLKPEFDEPAFRTKFDPLFRGEKKRLEFRTIHRRADGSDYPVEVRAHLTGGPERQHVLAFIADITERAQMEGALSESRRALSSLLNNVPGMVYRRTDDTKWSFSFVSDGCRAVTGYERSELEEDGTVAYLDLVHPADRDTMRVRCRASEARGACSCEYRIATRSGDIRWVCDRSEGIYADDGTLLYIDGLVTDVTRQRQTELALRALSVEITGSDIEAFCQIAARRAAEIVGAEFGFVGKATGKPLSEVQTLAVWADGRFVPNFRYGLDGTPCEDVVGKTFCFFGSNVRGRFPRDAMLVELGVEAYVAMPLFDDQQRALGLVGVMSRHLLTDDTNVKNVLELFAIRIEAEFARTRDHIRFMNLFECAPDAVVMVDSGGRIMLANRQSEQLFGYERGELLGMTVETLVPDKSRAEHAALRDRYSREPEAHTMGAGRRHLVGRRKDGTEFPAAISLSPLDADGDRFTLAAVRDVSSLIAAQAQAYEALAVLESMDDGVMFFDPVTLRYTNVNECASRQLGYSPTELLNMTVVDVKPDFDEQRFRDLMEPLLRGEVRTRVFTTRHRRKDGHDLSVEIALVYIAPPGVAPRVICLVRDISERRRAEDAIIQLNSDLEHRIKDRTAQLEAAREAADAANRAKSTFLANMSHEIRTPLNAIVGLVELVSHTQDRDEQSRMLRTARESVKSLVSIVDDILDFSKIEAGMLTVQRRPISIRGVVASAVEVFTASAEAKGLYLRVTHDDRIPAAVQCDPQRLRQILSNLLGNALKFTHEGGVEVSTALQEDPSTEARIRIEVADTGIGIKPESQARLFKPFVQAEASIAQSYGGTGLGLAISRRLAELLGGSLAIESNSAKGTTMVLTLPLTIASEVDLTATFLALPAPMALHHRKLLIVDDNAINRQVLSRQLRMLGCDADEAQHGQEALQMWLTGDYALLISDCQMPVMNGYDLARSIREIEANEPRRGRIPIVASTANAMQDSRDECLAAGMDEVLTKPLRLATLADMLSRLLSSLGAADAVDPVDWRCLDEITGGDRAFGREMLREFLATKVDEARRLSELLADGDFGEIERLAHRLKGSARTIAAQALAAVCEEIESAARVGERKTVAAGRPGLDREFERLTASVRPETR